MVSWIVSTRIRLLTLVCWLGFLGLMLATQPTIAQSSPPEMPVKVAVVIDGRVLFKLGSVEGIAAPVRADFANAELQRALSTSHFHSPIRVSVVEQDALTTIRVNNRHVLTVTDSDFIPGVTLQEQATDWATRLEAALRQAQRERSPAYHQRMAWVSLASVAIATLLYILLGWGRRYLWRQQTRRSGQSPYWQQLAQPLLLGLQGLVWIGLGIFLAGLFPLARSGRYQLWQFLQATFTGALFTLGGQGFSLLDGFKLILVAIGLWIGVRGLTVAVKSRFLQAAIPDRGVQDAIATLLQVGLTGLGLFLILQAWGIDLSALAILASVLGVGLGFGLQNIANNFVSGWIILIERPVQVGDFINLGDLAGTVERVGARSTEIRTLDRVSIIVPNADLIQTKVVNWSHGHPVSRLHLPLAVAYGSEIPQVHRAVMEAAQVHPEVLRHPDPQLRFLGFGDSALEFDLLVWIREPRHQFDIKSDLYYLLEANLRRYHIDIPFPQRELHLRTAPVGWPVAGDGAATPRPPATPVPQRNPPSPVDLLATVKPYSALLQRATGLGADELRRLVAEMRGSGGVEICDRRFRLFVYPQCFIGSEAVTWLMDTQKATREAAVRIGQTLVERGVIHHVTDEHSFKDEYLFYRFYEDER
jgi:potassium efflux system protein